MDSPSFIEVTATLCFILALAQTFLSKRLQHWAGTFPSSSKKRAFFHAMGEVEVAFGAWAGFFLLVHFLAKGGSGTSRYLGNLGFTEPAFVLAIMLVASTRPVLFLADRGIGSLAALLPFKRSLAFYLTALTVGPLLGSFITEPAAMAVTALLLKRHFLTPKTPATLLYATLGLLFVNVSIGGTLTPFAAPPILMVAGKWDWDLGFMLVHFGWKGVLACLLSTGMVAYRFRKDILRLGPPASGGEGKGIPSWLLVLHGLFLAGVAASSHQAAIFGVLLLAFLALVKLTEEHQSPLLLKNAALVALFLTGLVVLGAPQRWWLEPLLLDLGDLTLFLGAAVLTAFTDNATLTYLGSQVPGLSVASRYALVAGSVVGGGLTVIANAPNPVGYGILKDSFGKGGIDPLGLFLAALPPTVIAAVCFWSL
jgi:hypothetical protein